MRCFQAGWGRGRRCGKGKMIEKGRGRKKRTIPNWRRGLGRGRGWRQKREEEQVQAQARRRVPIWLEQSF
jgi:hypothetical protein